MSTWQGFWYYVHADDEAEAQRISHLAKDVASQVEMLTGEPLALFLDKDAVNWGEGWRDKVDSSLGSVAFFIPVMTPRYFMSPECRRELQFFARRATSLGIQQLVLPLLYVDVTSLHDETTTDDLLRLVRTFQWEDWREIRFLDISAEGYRRGVARLAARLVDANHQIEKINIISIAANEKQSLEALPDDSPGFLDTIGTAEETMPKLVMTIEEIAAEITDIGVKMQEANAEIKEREKQTKGVAPRLIVARKLSRLLAEPAERVWSLGNDFASQQHEVDPGIRALIERSTDEIRKNPDSKQVVCGFFKAIRKMSSEAHTALDTVQGMIDAIAPIEKLSRDLRPSLRRLRQGLTVMVEAGEVSAEWIILIDSSGIVCEEEDSLN